MNQSENVLKMMRVAEIFCSFLESLRVSNLTSAVILHLCEGVWMYLTGVHFNINCVHKYKSQKKDMKGYIGMSQGFSRKPFPTIILR